MPKGDREIYKADCEDGFTKIANLLLEALAMARLNGVQKGICMFLFRRTYGWNRTADAISLGEFAEACGTSKPYASRQLNDLIKKNIVCRVEYQPGKVPVYSFITSVDRWDAGCIDLQALSQNAADGLYECAEADAKRLYDSATHTVQGLHDCAIQGLYKSAIQGLHECAGVNQPADQILPGFEPFLKTERKTVKDRKEYPPESIPYQLSELLLTKILEHLPGYKKPDIQKWAKQMDALLRLDHRDPEEVKAVILFAQQDTFWQGNILSVEKLRKQYDQLNAKRLQSRGRASPPVRRRHYDKTNGEEADEYKGFFQ